MKLRIVCRIAAALAAFLTAAPAFGAGLEVLPVPAATIYPGDVIDETMLADQEFPPGTAARFPVVAGREAVVGKVARRTLLAGKAIPSNAVAEPDLVTRGQVTAAVYEAGSVTISAMVLPLQSGPLGATVQVRNVDSGRVIVGMVQGDGRIRIIAP